MARQAAQQMMQKAQQMAQQSGLPMEQFMSDPQTSQQMGPKGPLGSRRDPVGRKGLLPESEGEADWFKMKGDVKTNTDVNRMDDVPEEYRGLVRDYFKALKKGGQ